MTRLVVWHRWLPPRHEADTAVDTVREWLRTLPGRLQVRGGDLLGSIGAATAATFECSDAVDVIEMALELLNEAENKGLSVCIAVTAGRFLEEEETLISEALERAQLFANRARPGELVLGPGAKDLVQDAFLFGRRVNAGAGAPRGITIDRDHAHRDDQSSQAIRELGAPTLPPTLESVLASAAAALDRGHRTLAFRGPVGAGASEVIAALASQRGGVPWRLAPALGGLVPLASLRAALLRRFGDPAGVTTAFESVDTSGILTRLTAGALVPRAALSKVLRAFIEAESQAGRTPWLVMSPLGQIDGATLEAILPVHGDGPSVLAARLGVDAEIPRPLREYGHPPHELALPPLNMTDALKVAEGALGTATSADVVRRVAVLGGDTVLGILDAARALIASGDLVHESAGFVWRKKPVEGAAAIDGEAILDARLEPLNDSALRVLEALCVLPEGSTRDLLERVASAHGVGASAFGEGMAALLQGALARDERHPRPSSPWVRWRVMGRMSEARSAALCAGVATALGDAKADDENVPLTLQRAYYLHEAGHDEDARAVVEDAISHIVAADYQRSARQLMGWMETWDKGAPPALQPDRFEPDEDGPPTREVPLAPIAGEDDEATSTGTLAAPAEDPMDGPASKPVPPASAVPPPLPTRPAAAPASASSAPPPLPVAPHSEFPDPSLELDEDPTRVASLSEPAMQAALAPRPAEEVPEDTPDVDVDLDITAEIKGVAAEEDSTSVAERWLDDTDGGAPETLPGTPVSRPPPLPRRAVARDSGAASQPPAIPPLPRVVPRLPAPDESEAFAAEMTVPHQVEAAEPDDEGETRVGPLPTLQEGVRKALRARDFGALETLLDASGSGRPAIHRLRAIGRLLRGDLTAARSHLVHAHVDDATTRTKVTLALVELCAGAPALGARASLEALADARRTSDPEGEWVARQVLAECLESLGHAAAARQARPEASRST